MAQVQFTGTSDFDKVKKDYDALALKTAKVEQENRKLRQESERGAKSAQKGRQEHHGLLTSAASAAKAMIAGYASITTAVQLATAAIREQRELQQQSLDVNVSQAAADAQIVLNLSGESAKVKQETIREVEAIADAVGIESAVPVKLAFSTAISKASGDRDLAIAATRRAAELQRFDPSNIATFAGGGVTLSKLLGTEDPREAFSFMLDVQGRSPVTDPAELMAELPGAIAAVTAADARGAGRESTREAGALFAALGQATQQKAAPTATASIQLSAQIADLFAGRADDPGGLAERIEAIQNDQQLQAQILSTLTGEAKFKEAFKQLLRGDDSIVTREFSKNLRGGGGAAALSTSGENFAATQAELGGAGVTDAIRLASTVNADRAEAERFRRENVAGAETARLRQLREERLAESGTGSMATGGRLVDFARRKLTGFSAEVAAEVTGNERGVTAAALAERQRQLRANPLAEAAAFLFPAAGGVLQSGLFDRSDQDLSADRRDKVESLERTRTRLGDESGLERVSQQQLEETRRQTNELIKFSTLVTRLLNRLAPGGSVPPAPV